MKTSERGLKLIKDHEGLRLNAYADPAKGWAVPTIGYGHTSAAGLPAVYRGMTITAQEADNILRRDVEKFENFVKSLIHVPLNQNQFDALVSFTFNLGPGNLERSTLRRKLNAGDYKGAQEQFHVWNKGDGKVMPGLVKRRAAEAALFGTPVSSHERPLQPPPADHVVTTPPPLKKNVDGEGFNATALIVGGAIALVVVYYLFGG